MSPIRSQAVLGLAIASSLAVIPGRAAENLAAPDLSPPSPARADSPVVAHPPAPDDSSHPVSDAETPPAVPLPPAPAPVTSPQPIVATSDADAPPPAPAVSAMPYSDADTPSAQPLAESQPQMPSGLSHDLHSDSLLETDSGAQKSGGGCAACQAAVGPGAQVLQMSGVTVFAEQIEQDPATGLIILTGSPRALHGTDEIIADRLIYDPMAQVFTAEGNVIIRQAGQEVRAQRATYSLSERSGSADEIHYQINNLFVDADRITIRPGPVYEALRATFTTCDREHKHYSIYARRLTVRPGDELVTRHTGINFLGFRLLTIPHYRKPLDPSREGNALYPTVGFDSRNGLYARKDFTLREKAPVWVDSTVQLNTLWDPSVGVMASTRGNLQYRASLYYRDTSENQRARHLQVTRLPEIGLVWSPGRAPRPGRFLSHQVAAVRYPNAFQDSPRWRLGAELSGGYFLQHRGDRALGPEWESQEHARVKLQLQGVKPVVPLGPLALNDLRFLLRQTFYDTGDGYSAWGVGIGKRITTGKWRFGVDRFQQGSTGHSPFIFDRVELREEWRPRFEYRSAGFNFSYLARLRGDDARLYDQVFSVSKLFHCIEPRLTYRARQQRFFLEIRIPGLSGFPRTRPDEPTTLEDGL